MENRNSLKAPFNIMIFCRRQKWVDSTSCRGVFSYVFVFFRNHAGPFCCFTTTRTLFLTWPCCDVKLLHGRDEREDLSSRRFIRLPLEETCTFLQLYALLWCILIKIFYKRVNEGHIKTALDNFYYAFIICFCYLQDTDFESLN